MVREFGIKLRRRGRVGHRDRQGELQQDIDKKGLRRRRGRKRGGNKSKGRRADKVRGKKHLKQVSLCTKRSTLVLSPQH